MYKLYSNGRYEAYQFYRWGDARYKLVQNSGYLLECGINYRPDSLGGSQTSFYIQSFVSENYPDGTSINADSIEGMPKGASPAGWIQQLALSPYRELGASSPYDMAFGGMVYVPPLGPSSYFNPGRSILYIGKIGGPYITTYRRHDTSPILINLIAPSGQNALADHGYANGVFYAAAAFFVDVNGQLYRVTKDGQTSPVITSPNEEVFTYVQDFGGDTVVAYKASYWNTAGGLYVSADGGRTFPSKFPAQFLWDCRLFKVGNKLVVCFMNRLFTFQFGSKIHLYELNRSGLPYAKIIGVYKTGTRVRCVTESGIYSKDYNDFMQNIADSTGH